MKSFSPVRHLRSHKDQRGTLVSIEGMTDVPFAIQRVYYILANTGRPRGFHAHKKLDQFLICPTGSCRVVLDNGLTRSECRVEGPEIGLHVPALIWHEMHDFSKDCLLLVLASAAYDEADYLRDYEEFRKACRESNGR